MKEVGYIRAPILNYRQINKTITNRDITTKDTKTKVYIRSPRCRYKLLGVSVKKKEMGKGDRKTFRGKLFSHSYGKCKPKKKVRQSKTTTSNKKSMKEYRIRHLTIYKYNFQFENKYRDELSKLLIEKFGEGPYSTKELVRESISFCYDYFCEKFVEICNNEKSLSFYQLILSQHEQAIEAALFASDKDYPKGIDREYIALYRRILKWILEEACNVELKNVNESSNEFITRAKNVLNELCYVGDMIFTCANIYAEQDMIEDVAELIFDTENKYVITHKHHYDFIIESLQNNLNATSFKHVVDENAVSDLKDSIETCFGIKYDHFASIIAEIHEANKNKGGQYCPFGWDSLKLSIGSVYGEDIAESETFYKGLTLDKSNKLKINDLACKPHSMFRYMYRPITIWNVDGEEYAIVGKNAFTESIIQLSTNCIPWGKAPAEWIAKDCFKNFVHSKEDLHDKWLDDEVEKKLNEEGLRFFRNVTNLNSNLGAVTLNLPNVGEIDFIIIDHQLKKITVSDCKHLQGKYDMMSQKNDFANFTKNRGYNTQIQNKIDFIAANIETIDFHNKSINGQSEPSLIDYSLEGIFIINQPTFYMYNSDYRIYTVDTFIERIKGKLVDSELLVTVVDENKTKIMKITYPYFRKPDYSLIEDTDDN